MDSFEVYIPHQPSSLFFPSRYEQHNGFPRFPSSSFHLHLRPLSPKCFSVLIHSSSSSSSSFSSSFCTKLLYYFRHGFFSQIGFGGIQSLCQCFPVQIRATGSRFWPSFGPTIGSGASVISGSCLRSRT